IFTAHNSLKVRFRAAQTQVPSRHVTVTTLGDGYITALHLLADNTGWMAHITANPMFLVLDLRGGAIFAKQVGMQTAMQK
ncbi:hypothetical protein PL75_11365, partial [Neisseria arctica]